MPKLPRQETKHSATPATQRRRHQRQHDRAQHRQRPAPPGEPGLDQLAAAACAAPRAASGTPAARTARRARRMIPAARVQRIAAAQRRRACRAVFSSGLDGPNSCSHASATTCGAIISGSTKQNTNALRAADVGQRHDQRDDRRRSTTASSVPPNAVTRLCARRGPGRRARQHAPQRARRRDRAVRRDAFEQQARERQHRQHGDDDDQPPEQRVVLERARAQPRPCQDHVVRTRPRLHQALSCRTGRRSA